MAAGAYDHTAAITAMIANVNRSKDNQAISPAKLNPFRKLLQAKADKKPKPMITKDNFDILKKVFVDRKGS